MHTCPLSYGQSLLPLLYQLRDEEPFWKGGDQTWQCSENPGSRESADVWRVLRDRSGACRSFLKVYFKGLGNLRWLWVTFVTSKGSQVRTLRFESQFGHLTCDLGQFT